MQTGSPADEKSRSDEHDVDLGDGHWLDWSEYQGEVCGGIITHTSSKNESGLCSGCFWISGNAYFKETGKTSPAWNFDGNYQAPTLHPSFLCHCGDHGFVSNGRWIRA